MLRSTVKRANALAYAAEPDPYCYPETNVLKNLLGLHEADALEAFEADAVTQRGDEPLPDGMFTPRHLKDIHHHLFQDVYPWAGEYRTVRISKDNSTFCYPEHIAKQMSGLLGWLKDQDFLRSLNAEEFAIQAAHFLSELNVIHPFREGNGRTQMIFLGLLAEQAGHPLDLGKLEPSSFFAAIIAGFNGNEAPLVAEIRQMI